MLTLLPHWPSVTRHTGINGSKELISHDSYYNSGIRYCYVVGQIPIDPDGGTMRFVQVICVADIVVGAGEWGRAGK